jgi:uncharacterized repeat protein (TIGR01451 family)
MKTNLPSRALPDVFSKLSPSLFRDSALAFCCALAAATASVRAQEVLFSQPLAPPYTIISATVSDVDFPNQVADNFTLAATGAVTRVRWWGDQVAAGTSFRVRFFAAAGSGPAATPFYDLLVTPEHVLDAQYGAGEVFTADLPGGVLLMAGPKYFLSVEECSLNSTYWYWRQANNSGSDSNFWSRPTDADTWAGNSFGTNKYSFELLGTTKADVAVDIAATPDPVRRSQNLTYTINVTNHGPLPAGYVILEDVLPPETTFQSITTTHTAFTPTVGSNGTVWVDLGDMASGATSQITLVVKVNAKGGSSIQNTVTVSSTTPDPMESNNSATISTGIFGSRK